MKLKIYIYCMATRTKGDTTAKKCAIKKYAARAKLLFLTVLVVFNVFLALHDHSLYFV